MTRPARKTLMPALLALIATGLTLAAWHTALALPAILARAEAVGAW